MIIKPQNKLTWIRSSLTHSLFSLWPHPLTYHPILCWLHFSLFVILSFLLFVFIYFFIFAQCLVEKKGGLDYPLFFFSMWNYYPRKQGGKYHNDSVLELYSTLCFTLTSDLYPYFHFQQSVNQQICKLELIALSTIWMGVNCSATKQPSLYIFSLTKTWYN